MVVALQCVGDLAQMPHGERRAAAVAVDHGVDDAPRIAEDHAQEAVEHHDVGGVASPRARPGVGVGLGG